ncbi:gap junction delta-3 protein [Alligator sinensis]|uniref:Gap junction protein n=1 Tax=Alligator sinensis TaxID=38654 RepID=A0A1U7RRA8_ALLSI|nr:gap junction delta-3 protein [Alligator sinensis]
MGEWGFLSSLLDTVQEHSPMVGRFWLGVMLIFRILILATVGGDVFEDEQEEFVCNTRQPGCKQVCYDRAFPVSHYRFLVFHVVVLSAPAVLFVIYSMHQTAKMARTGKGGSQCGAGPQPTQRRRHIRAVYVANVITRILAEVSFLLGQWQLYGFEVETTYVCQRAPCPHRVDCFVSRPTEKTIFIHFYFVVGMASAGLSLVELAHLLYKGRCQRRESASPSNPAGATAAATEQQDNWSNQAQEQAQCFLPPESRSTQGSPCSSAPEHYKAAAPIQPKDPIPRSKASPSVSRDDLTI